MIYRYMMYYYMLMITVIRIITTFTSCNIKVMHTLMHIYIYIYDCEISTFIELIVTYYYYYFNI